MSRDHYIQQAFESVLKGHKTPEQWFVCLIASHQAYGGPEEGGWWYSVSSLEAWQDYPSKEMADAALESVKSLAKELQQHARSEHGRAMLASMEWLEERGLEASFLPEPDGPTEYQVRVCSELPKFSNRRPHYE